ncbi:MAG: TetR/AcrR family transcriptional regulator [Flavipsychrobacter sp.]
MTAANQDDVVQEEILRAAIKLYRKFGPNKVTMDDVATATGRSRSSLYYYFKNREDIFNAVLDTIVNDVALEIRQAISEAKGTGDKIYAFCVKKIKTSHDWKSVFSAMWASMDSEDQSKHTRNMDTLHKKLVHKESILLNEILAEGIKNGEIRAISADEQDILAFLVSSGIRGLRREIYDQNDPHDIKAALRLLSDMILKWLKD